MTRRVPWSGKERRTTIAEHVEVAGQQLHWPVLIEGCGFALDKRPVDLSLLDQQRRVWKNVDISHMVGVRMGNGDKSEVRWLEVELAKLRSQLLRARRMTNGRVDWLVGDRIGIPGVPQQPLLAVLEEDARVGHLDRLADVHT